MSIKKPFSVALTAEQRLKLKDYADAYELTEGAVIRLLITHFLHESENDLCPEYNSGRDCRQCDFVNLVYNIGKHT